MLHRLTIVFILCLFCIAPSLAQKKQPAKSAAPAAEAASYHPQLYAGMKWRCIGPYQGGRSLAVSGVLNDPLTYYMGATGGGVWKTTDGGNYWFGISDSNFTSASVGALAVAPSNSNIIYVGMGEAAIRNTAIMGDGIYKSDDAGKSWKHMLKMDASATGRLIVHPKNPDVVYAAVMGKMFGKNKERGVYRTTDGGVTWKNILFKNDSTGAIDIDFDPTNPNILYASLWQVNRKPWKLDSGGPGCELYKSTDGGDTWKSLSQNPGMPKGVLGKICSAVSATNPNRIYSLIESKTPGMYRSDDGGKAWSLVSKSNDITQRPWYFSEVFVDPNNQDVVYVCNLNLMKSIDGGKTYSTISVEHGDCHEVWINPNDSQNFILGDDGSASVTFNGGRTFTDLEIPTAQLYHVNLDDDFPYHASGGQQDWGSISIATRTYGSSIGRRDWKNVAGGEAGYIVPQPGNPDVTYGGEYDGILSRHDQKNEQYKYVNVHPMINDGWGGNTWKYRFAWTFPIAISPWNKDVLYCTSNHVHRSMNGGLSWETISSDLTRDDPSRQLQSGGVLTPDNTGAEIYCTIYAFAESAAQQGLMWAGSDDGLVHLSNDNGKTWNNVTPAGLPEWTTISIIEPSVFDAGTCFIAAHRYRVDDTKPYLYRTTDFGRTWTKITSGIGANDYTRCVREDPNRKGLLYCGTETGVSVSFNHGDIWQSLKLNLPMTPVWDIQVKKDLKELVIATHGRSFWVLDDLTPLYQLNSTIVASESYLFQPNTALRIDGRQISEERAAQIQLAEGTNAPNGVLVNYYLKKTSEEEIRMTFYTEKGDSIISFSSKTNPDGKPFVEGEEKNFFHPTKPSSGQQLNAQAGMHRFVWDMRYPSSQLPEASYWNTGQLRGPKALPGKYKVRLFVGGKKVGEEMFNIQLNPKVNATQEDLQAQFDLTMKINRKQDALVKKIVQIRSVKKQVGDFLGSFSDTTLVNELKKVSRPLLDSLSAIEDTLINSKIKTGLDPLRFPNQLLERYGCLVDFVASSDSRPAQQMTDVFEELNTHFNKESKRLDKIFDTLIPAFNKAVEEKKLKVVDEKRAVKKE